jgi:hypothetical protein
MPKGTKGIWIKLDPKLKDLVDIVTTYRRITQTDWLLGLIEHEVVTVLVGYPNVEATLETTDPALLERYQELKGGAGDVEILSKEGAGAYRE